MSGISSLGVGSGLDLNALVERLVAAERAPTKGRLDRSEGKTKTELSAVGSLRAAVSQLQSAVTALSRMTTQYKAESSAADVVQASLATSGGAEPGAYQIRVVQLASAQSLASEVFADADEPLGAGSLTLRVGDSEAQIEIGAGIDSPRQLRDAINASSVGIQAALVRDGDGMRLLLTSRTTGAAGEMHLDVTGTVDPRLGRGAMTETATAEDASFSVNGLMLAASSNRIDDVIPGVVLTLTGTSPATGDASVTVSRDQGAVRNHLGALITAYNALRENITGQSRYDAATDSAGPLLGDATTRGLQSRLAGIFSAPLLTDAAFDSMLDLGFTTGLDGKVSLDDTRLRAALDEDQTGVEQVVAEFAGRLASVLGDYGGAGGVLQTRVDGLNERLQQIERQRDDLDRRMAQVEARLRIQFTALDAMVAQFQSTSRFLTDQLASLADLRPGRSN